MTRLSLAVAATLVLAGCSEPPPSNTLRVSGHVEATETRLAPDAGGRIVNFTLREGDRVQAGAEILALDQRDVLLALQRARADRAQADANLRLVMAGARDEDIRQAESQVTAAEADVSAAKAELASAEQDLQRFETLLTSNSGSRKQRDDAATRRDVASDRLAAAAELVNAAHPLLRQAVQTNGDASVINISSMYGMVSPDPRVYGQSGMNNPPHYGAAKAALLQYTRYAAVHLAPEGIRVNAISPGPFPPEAVQLRDPAFAAALIQKVPLGRLGKPDDLAGAAVFLACSASRFVTGAAPLPIGGMRR